MDLQENYTHFPAMKQIQCERYIFFPTSNRFDNFILREQVLLFIQNTFLVKNATTFSQEAKLTYNWVDVASLPMELVDLQASVALREQCGVFDSDTVWLQCVPVT